MATRDIHTRDVPNRPGVRDNPPAGGDQFARESNTWRRMKPYQAWIAAAAAAAFVIAGLIVLY
ncbi:MAG TPA: hypothetical protein VFC18_15480 [Burkholderiales bacterium]|nr:hypothetical protein [Burkholderiales bacterium]